MPATARLGYKTTAQYPKEWTRTAARTGIVGWPQPRSFELLQSPKFVVKFVEPVKTLSVNEAKFNRLVSEWQAAAAIQSSAINIAMHPAYQQMIGMGVAALPLILNRLKSENDEPNHWFWALASISTENPVPEESRGRIVEMANAWLVWGKENGYVQLD